MPWKKLKSADIIWSDNGSPTSKLYGDVYYNNEKQKSGLEESQEVFIKAIGAPDIWQKCDSFSIFELGFGTGLNFFNCWDMWQKSAPKNARLNFISVEANPLQPNDIKKALSPFAEISAFVAEFLDQYPPLQAGFHTMLFAGGRVRLTLLFGEASEMLPLFNGKVDAWFLDGFAPSKNPDMWNENILHEITRLSADRVKIATFSAASQLKRDFEKNGFTVKKHKGYGKKRERITAHKSAKGKTKKEKINSVGIIGAGIAGVMLADKLKKRGLNVCLIDRHGVPAQETSSNPAALISPKLAIGNDAYDRLLSHSFLHAVNYYNGLDDIWLTPRGLINIAQDNDAYERQQITYRYFKDVAGWQNQLESISPTEIKNRFAIKSEHEAVFFPHAGSIDTIKLFKRLTADIEIIKADISKLKHDGEEWQAYNGQEIIANCQAIIVAGGLDSYELLDGGENPFTANRGQISLVEDDGFDENLPSVSFGHYLTAAFELDGKKQRIIGASHKRIAKGDAWQNFNKTDEVNQLEALNGLTGKTHISQGYKVGLRATTIDHMPIVGGAVSVAGIKKLPKHRQKIFPHQLGPEQHHAGLYLMTGLGARGFQLAPLLSEIMLAHLLDEPMPIDRDILDAIDPARFILRKRRHEKL